MGSLVERLEQWEKDISYAFGSEGPYINPSDIFYGRTYEILVLIRDALEQIRRQ